MKADASRRLIWLLLAAVALLWATPFAWMAVASLRPHSAGLADIGSLFPAGPFDAANFIEAWQSGHFPLWYLNTVVMCGGILLVQCFTVSLAGYAFARLNFRGKTTLFYVFLLQLMLVPPILIVPNMTTLISLHLYDTLLGVMVPYFVSAFGVFLMRQTFRTIPRDYEEAAMMDGAPANAANDLGRVSSAVFSPTLGHQIGLGLLAGGVGRLSQRLRAFDPVRGRDVAVEVVRPCFVDPERERLRV